MTIGLTTSGTIVDETGSYCTLASDGTNVCESSPVIYDMTYLHRMYLTPSGYSAQLDEMLGPYVYLAPNGQTLQLGQTAQAPQDPLIYGSAL